MFYCLVVRGRKKLLLNDRCLKNIEGFGFVYNLYISYSINEKNNY